MAKSAQIAKLSTRHDIIIDFLIANPTMKKGEVAKAFGVTQAWLSTVIHSDVFQAKLAERQEKFFATATTTIREKLETLAHLALDKMIEEHENDLVYRMEDIRANAAMALERLGYGPRPAAGSPVYTQNNTFVTADASVLAAARERILNRDGSRVLSAPSLALPAGGDS